LDKILGFNFKKTFTRSQFENLIEKSIDKSIKITKNTINQGSLQVSDIDRVILIGGSTYIPLIREKLNQVFGAEKIKCHIDPDLAVGMGAAIYTAYKMEASIPKLGKMNESRTIPLSLGTDICNEEVSIIIPRGFNIPCNKTRRYETTVDNQTRVSIQIFEGEGSLQKENKKLGKFILSEIPPLPKGEAEIDVTIGVNEDTTVIEVTAKCIQNSEEKQVKMVYKGARLTEKEKQEIFERDCENYYSDDEFDEVHKKEDFQAFISNIEDSIEDPRSEKYLSSGQRESLNSLISQQRVWINKNSESSGKIYQRQKKEVERVWKPLFRSMQASFYKDKGYTNEIDIMAIDDLE
jgi:molecular chaperone DnaK (HSP70)